MSALRVLWVIGGLNRGGAERLLLATAQRLDRDRVTPEVAVIRRQDDALRDALEALAVPVHDLGTTSLRQLRWAPRLRTLTRERGYDVVHTHTPAAAPIVRLLSRGTPVVHTEHSPWRQHRAPVRWANAATLGSCAHVVAVSDAVATSVAPRRAPVEVVRHAPPQSAVPATPERRAKARADLGLPDEAAVVGSVANFEDKKDHPTLLRAAALLRSRHPGLRLVLAGFGPREAALRALADELGLGDAVVWTGSRDDVPALLPAFDVLAHAPRFEGFGLAPLEAMAAGVPVVASDVDGLPEVLGSPPAGLLVPSGDPGALAVALDALLGDPTRREDVARRGQARARSFELDAAVARLEAIYHEVTR